MLLVGAHSVRTGAAVCRKLAGTLLAVSALVMGAPSHAQTTPRGQAQTEVAVDALSVVRVSSRALPDARSAATLGAQRTGSGIVIDSDGLVLTIGYLVTEAERVEVATTNGWPIPATVISSDSTTGMALIKAQAPLQVRPIDFGESAEITDRELVLIVGYDGVAPAYVVSKRPFVGYWEYLLDEAIYTAPATVNWQGAALLSREGRLLGIGSLVVGDALGTSTNLPGNMFVPIDAMKPVIGDIIANGRTTSSPRPWLGVNTQEVGGNIVVMRVSPEGPAEQAGLQRGDVIVGVRGEPVKSQADFYVKIWASGAAGVDVPIDVRTGTEVHKRVVKSMDRNRYFRSNKAN
jgi:serine protease Do